MKLSMFQVYYFLVAAINGVFGMAMPLYYDSLHYSPMQTASLIAMPSFVMLFQPFWGIIVDKFQKPKEIAIFGLMGSSLVLMLMIWFKDYHEVLIITFIYSFIRMPVWSTVDNIIITYCLKNNRSYGKLRVFASIAWGSSLLIFLPIILIFGFQSYFISSTILSVFISYIILKFPSDITLEESTSEELDFNKGLKMLLNSKTFYFIIFFTLFFSSMFVTNLVYQNIYLKELGVNGLLIAFITFLSVMPEMFVMPFIEKILHKFNDITWLIIVCIIYIVRFMVMGSTSSVIILSIVALFHGIAMSFYIPVFIKHLKRSVPDNVSTTALTINGFMAAISGIITSYIAGIIRSNSGAGHVFYFNAFTMLIATIILIFYYKYSKTKKQNTTI